MERPEVRYARAADGASIAYQAFGAGRYDIVYMSGWISHLDLLWESPQEVDWFQHLAGLGRVVMLDRRGVGLSDRFTPGEAPPVEVLVEDLGAVMDAAGVTRPILLGSQTGAQLACLYAASHPDRVRGLATYAMWSHLTGRFLQEWQTYLEWTGAHFGSTEAALNEVRDVQPSRAGDPDHLAWMARLHRSAWSPGSFRPMVEVQMALDIRDVLPAISVPTLAMYRRGDSSVPVEDLEAAAALIPGATVVELPGNDHECSAGPIAPIVDALERFIAGLDGEPIRPSRRLTTVLFTDVVGSTARASEIGDSAWRDLIAAHHRIVRRELERFSGTEVDTAGDGFFATFDGPARAVHCAQAIGSRVRDIGLEIRAGVHTGEIETINGKVGGIAVHIGARIAALAGASEILVSSTVKDLTAGSGLVFEDAGEHELKGVPDRWRLHRVGR
jgi:class 3 adenylate cyclase